MLDTNWMEGLTPREAEVAAEVLRDFANDIRNSKDWTSGRRSPANAIAASASSRASEILSKATLDREPAVEKSIESELASLLNRYSQENASGTPDFILAHFMINVLYHYNEAIAARSKWRSESVELPALTKLEESKRW